LADLFVMVRDDALLAPGRRCCWCCRSLTFGWRGSIAANLGILAGNAIISRCRRPARRRAAGLVRPVLRDQVDRRRLPRLARLGASSGGAKAGRQPRRAPGRRRRFAASGTAWVLQLANPKALLFFAALRRNSSIRPAAVAWQVAILGFHQRAISSSSWPPMRLGRPGFGRLASRRALPARRPDFRLLLMAAGLGMALLRRV